MLRNIGARMTYANVMATVAVFIALGGSGYAATKINGKNIKNKSIAGKKLKNRTITAGKVKKNTLGGTEIAESRLGQVGSAASADNATHADNADNANNATNANTAGNANLIDGIDSSVFARRSDGVGFLVAPNGWAARLGSSFTGVNTFPGQTDFTNSTSATGKEMKLPLSYPTSSNGRPLRITSIRVCRNTTSATITGYGIETGSGDSAATNANEVTVSKSGFGCDVLNVASVNGGVPFPADGTQTLDFLVRADFSASGHVALGGAQLTLIPG
jgi:hypothetical protein